MSKCSALLRCGFLLASSSSSSPSWSKALRKTFLQHFYMSFDLIRYALILREVVTAKRTSQGVKATYKIVVNRKECLPQEQLVGCK